ncbi:MAG: hypothetical protein ACE5DS_06300 [Kiloniellaceae bacterium]
MDNSGDGTVIKVPNLLRAKVGTAPGPSLDKIVAEAEKALDGLQSQSRAWIQDYLATLAETVESARAGAMPKIEAIERVRKIAHDIKGQGATFGYPLLTVVGHMLHGFTERDPAAAARHLEVVAAHVNFMNLVIKHEIHDTGGPQVARMLSGLESAAAKVRDE